MLGDAAGFASRNIGGPQCVQQGGLAVIDMAHDGYDRGAREQIVIDVCIAFKAQFDVGFRHAANPVPELLHHQFGGIGIQRLGDGRHDAHLHQRLDDFRRARGHTIGQFLHGDGLWQNDVSHDFHLIGPQPVQFGLPAFAFALTANRRQGADLFVLAFDRGLNIDTASAAAVIRATLRRGDGRLADRRATGAGAAHRTAFFLVLRTGGTQTQRLGRRGGCSRSLRACLRRILGGRGGRLL